MDVKEAVEIAKHSVLDLFSDQIVTEPLLEEVEFDENGAFWSITIGYLRLPEFSQDSKTAPVNRLLMPPNKLAVGMPRRVYKVVKIGDQNQKIMSVKDPELR